MGHGHVTPNENGLGPALCRDCCPVDLILGR